MEGEKLYRNAIYTDNYKFGWLDPHPESLKFPPRYKCFVVCGPLASLANFLLSISQNPEHYTMSEVRLAHYNSPIMQLASKILKLFERYAFQFAINCHLSCRTGHTLLRTLSTDGCKS